MRVPRVMARSSKSYCLVVQCFKDVSIRLASAAPFRCERCEDARGGLDFRDRNPLLSAVRERDIARTKAYRRNARFVEKRRVRPRGKPFDWAGQAFCTKRARQLPHDRRFDTHVARRLRGV